MCKLFNVQNVLSPISKQTQGTQCKTLGICLGFQGLGRPCTAKKYSMPQFESLFNWPL